MNYEIVKRDPSVGYLDNWLWLPKAKVSEAQVRASLTFLTGKGVITGWREAPHHILVPRNYLSAEALSHLSFPVYDIRYTEFPYVEFKSDVTLDFVNPHLTVQRDSVNALLSTHDGIISLRCGAGKTLCALHAIAQQNTPALIVVDNKGLAEQWLEEIEKWLGIPREDVGMIGGDGGRFDWEKPLCIGIVNTIAKHGIELPPEISRHFGVMVADEVHHLAAVFFNRAVHPFQGRRWGLSATPHREDGLDSLLFYSMGPVLYTYLQPDLVPKVVFKSLPTMLDLSDPYVLKRTHTGGRVKDFHFGMTYDYFGTDRHDRTQLIADEVNKALSKGRRCLILSHSRSQIDALHQHFPQAGICHADIPQRKRLENIRECNPVIAIMKLGKEALNEPRLDTLFVCEPTTKEAAVQQILGRIQRKSPGKMSPIAVFFEDTRILPLRRMCLKVRRMLHRWPKNKGGEIKYVEG